MPPQEGTHSYFWAKTPKLWHESFRNPTHNRRAQELGGFTVVTPLPSGTEKEVFVPHSDLIPLIDQHPPESIHKLTIKFGIPPEDAAGLLMQEKARLELHQELHEYAASQSHNARDTYQQTDSSSYFDSPAAWTAFVQTVSQFPNVPYQIQVEISIQSRQRGSIPTRLVTPEFLESTDITPPPRHQAFTLGVTPAESTTPYFEHFEFHPYFAWDDAINGVELEAPPRLEPLEGGWQWPHIIEKEQSELDPSSKALALGKMILAELNQLRVPIVARPRREYLDTAYATGYNPDASLALTRNKEKFAIIVPRPKNIFAAVDELSMFDAPAKMRSLVSAYSQVAASKLDRVNQSGSAPLSTALGYILLSPLMKNPSPYQFRAPGLQVQGSYETFAQQISLAASYLETKLQASYDQLAKENSLSKTPVQSADTTFSTYLTKNAAKVAEINRRALSKSSQPNPTDQVITKFLSEKVASLSETTPTGETLESLAPAERLFLQRQSSSEPGQPNPGDAAANQTQGKEQLEAEA